MSRNVTENRLPHTSMSVLASKAFCLRERAKTAQTPLRASMLDTMAEAYVAFGLAKAHLHHRSFQTARELKDEGDRLLSQARLFCDATRR